MIDGDIAATSASVTGAEGLRPISGDDLKVAFRLHPGGVALITANGQDGPVAMTATSVASVSAEPPLLVFSVSALSSSTPTILAADTVVVHLLSADDLGLARLGATSGIDRFADTTLWTSLPSGEPVFHGPSWLRCTIVDRFAAGAATLVIAQPVESHITTSGDEGGLVYRNRTWHRLDERSRIEDPSI